MPNPENVIGKGRPFRSGQSGNARGRPKKPAIDKLLSRVLAEQKDGLTAALIILKAIRAKACRGDVSAAEWLLNRAYGKVRQTYDLTTKGRPFENRISKIEVIKTARDQNSAQDERNS